MNFFPFKVIYFFVFLHKEKSVKMYEQMKSEEEDAPAESPPSPSCVSLGVILAYLVGLLSGIGLTFLFVVYVDGPFDNNQGIPTYPTVIATWEFSLNSSKAAFDAMVSGSPSVDAIVSGCTVCEMKPCSSSVGFGGSPNDEGETTLDAMIMDGNTMSIGSVGMINFSFYFLFIFIFFSFSFHFLFIFFSFSFHFLFIFFSFSFHFLHHVPHHHK
jgi:hypothetical protein